MFCPYCGATNRDGAAFCTSCRATMPSQPEGGWATPYVDREPLAAPPAAYAGFWERAAASIMDNLIALAMAALAGVIVFVAFGANIVSLILAFLVAIPIAAGYQIVAVAHGGGFGMRAMGIRVVRDEDGTNPGYGRSVLRLVVRGAFGIVPGVGYVLPLVDNLWMIKDARKQTLHDKAARTCVVER
jgi:uncharacterized RDD family membrane protein YckC